MQGLPASPPNFVSRKRKILDQLSVPEAAYEDASPKGSVDEGIRDLIDEINDIAGFVTTSSCAGRVSVFLEGRKVSEAEDEDSSGQVAGVGGKGAGGTWLFVSHEPVAVEDGSDRNWTKLLRLAESDVQDGTLQIKEKRLIHFKFEPMILHVLTASPTHAQLLLRSALQAGFRESGALNITPTGREGGATPMVAIRSMGLAFESLIGQQVSSQRQQLVTPEYLQTLMQIANERFAENTKRIQRFRTAFLDAIKTSAPKMNPEGEEWEDAAARKERKRAAGLRRKAEMEAQKAEPKAEAKDLEGDWTAAPTLGL